MKDYIVISRELFSSELWKKKHRYSELEAMLYLIINARIEEGDLTTTISGRKVTYSRGQYPVSIRSLSAKWEWGEREVRTFLTKLTSHSFITIDCSQGVNVISICGFDGYVNKLL